MAKQAKKRHSTRKETRIWGSRLTGVIPDDPIHEFSPAFIWTLKILPMVRRENKPKFDSVYKRKLMCLYWLQGDQEVNGHFSPFSITKYYALKDNTWSNRYFSRLITENWILPIDTHLPTHRRAVLSPLFYSLLQSITNTLRREHPERFRAQDIAALSPEVQAMKPESSTLDMIETIIDNR